MSQNFYKQVVLSQLIISIWILYGFFDYLMEDKGVWFPNVGVLVFFLYSCMYISGVGLIVTILRLTWFRKYHRAALVKTFIYVITGVFNGYLAIIWVVSGILGLIEFDNWLSIVFILVALISATTVLYDFYKIRSSENLVIDSVE